MKKDNNMVLFEKNLHDGVLSKSAYENVLNDCYKKKEKVSSGRSNNGKDKISVIIPTHNRLEQLDKCIDSILSQNYKNVEIIIIDDVSTDKTQSKYENIKNDKIVYIRNSKNLGMGLNRQKAFNIATGDFIIFCDDDDYFIDNTYFSDAIKIFKDKEIDVICSSSYIHYETDNTYQYYELNFKKKINSLDYLERFQFDLKKPTSTFPAIFRKKSLDEADFKNMKMMNDSSIYLRCLMLGRSAYANEKIIGVYRVHDKNDTFNVKADFTIKNLKEKKYIYKYLRQNNVNFDLKKWFVEQIKITTCHFLNGKEKSNYKRNKVLYWVKYNVSKDLFKELKKHEKEKRNAKN